MNGSAWELLVGMAKETPSAVAAMFIVWMFLKRDREKDQVHREDKDRTAQSFKNQEEHYGRLLSQAYVGKDRRGTTKP